jgi:4-oxalocrotonate tautomerase
MPVVIIEMWEGRSIEQKKQVVKEITATFVKLGVPADAVTVVLNDVPKHNWGTAGKLASEG